ncbi:Panacea domain-containing protein [Pseudoscardovia radai]|uniref:Panacea domain-containing protein n=1 Tax=Pseudoscardovia radai TaxID=987066 RepID=UPI003996AC94
MTTSLDIAAWLVSRHGNDTSLSNLSLNKLCYFAQVTALSTDGKTLFDDDIQAWEYGPVCPAVYHAYKHYGRLPVRAPESHVPTLSERENRIMEKTWEKYGWLSPFDLVRLSHRKGCAWSKTYKAGENATISPQLILDSDDVKGFDASATFAHAVAETKARYSNTLRLLEDS